eukprot:scaffold37095_cov183-Amphora_coffeaeformis.AAC.2
MISHKTRGTRAGQFTSGSGLTAKSKTLANAIQLAPRNVGTVDLAVAGVAVDSCSGSVKGSANLVVRGDKALRRACSPALGSHSSERR